MQTSKSLRDRVDAIALALISTGEYEPSKYIAALVESSLSIALALDKACAEHEAARLRSAIDRMDKMPVVGISEAAPAPEPHSTDFENRISRPSRTRGVPQMQGIPDPPPVRGEVPPDPKQAPCTKPPAGWRCTLAAGHSGPCPTVDDENYPF